MENDRPLGTLTLLLCVVAGLAAVLLSALRFRARNPLLLLPLGLLVAGCAQPDMGVKAEAVAIAPVAQEVRKAVRASAQIGEGLARQASAIERQRAALERQRAALRRARALLDGKTLVP